MNWRGWAVRRRGILGVSALVGCMLATPALAGQPTTAAERPCAVGDLRPVTVPAPSPLPVHKPSHVPIGGDALAGNGLAVAPGAPALPDGLAATSWLVADLDTGEVIGACGAHRMLAPASVQKVLLTATVLPKLDPADSVTVTPADLDFGAEWDSKTVPLQAGQVYTVEDLFLGLLLRSGNDAANALARIAGGERGVAGTVADMNAEARRLGAWDTHAATPSGLDGPGQVSSAYDQALIFRAAYAHEQFRRWVRTPDHQLTPELQIQHDNWEYLELPGSLGGKAGYTDIARHSFVGAAERDGRRLVAAVMGAEVMPARGWQQAAALLDWGFAQPRGTSVGHLVEPGEADAAMASRRPEPPPSVVIAPVSSSDGAAPAFLLAGAIGAGAILSLTTIILAGRRRRRTLAAAAMATSAAPVAAAQPPAAEPSPPAAPPSDPPAPPPPRPLMGQPPPPPTSPGDG